LLKVEWLRRFIQAPAGADDDPGKGILPENDTIRIDTLQLRQARPDALRERGVGQAESKHFHVSYIIRIWVPAGRHFEVEPGRFENTVNHPDKT